MGRFTLRLPKTLHNEPDILAKGEGVSLNQYIVYALTQKVTSEKLVLGWGSKDRKLTPEETKLLANIKLIPQEQVSEQYEAFEALLSRLGKEASDEEVEQYLSEREPVEPEADLRPEAVARFREHIAQAKQYT
jgi:hypothetical protein